MEAGLLQPIPTPACGAMTGTDSAAEKRRFRFVNPVSHVVPALFQKCIDRPYY
jgi:hypothetical protein